MSVPDHPAQWALNWLDAHYLALEAEAVADVDRALADAAGDVLRVVRGAFRSSVPGSAWSSDDARYAERMNALTAGASDAVETYAGRLRNILAEHGRRGYFAGYYGAVWMATQALPEGAREEVGFRRLSSDHIASILAKPWGGNDAAGRVAKHRLDVLDSLRREFIRSQLEKDGQQQAERRVLWLFDVRQGDLVEGFYPVAEAKRGGRTQRGRSVRKSQQARIARMTAAGEAVHARAMAATTAFEEMGDVVKGWRWMTAADMGTAAGVPVCPECLPYSGREFFFGANTVIPPLHDFCRCEQLVLTRSLAEIEKRLGVSMGEEVPGPLPRQGFAEWAMEAGVPYDGGLSAVKPRTRRAVVRKITKAPQPVLPPEVPRVAMAKARHAAEEWARKNVKPVARPMLPPSVNRVAMAKAAKAAYDWARRMARESVGDAALTEHLPGEHDQKTHGRRYGAWNGPFGDRATVDRNVRAQAMARDLDLLPEHTVRAMIANGAKITIGTKRISEYTGNEKDRNLAGIYKWKEQHVIATIRVQAMTDSVILHEIGHHISGHVSREFNDFAFNLRERLQGTNAERELGAYIMRNHSEFVAESVARILKHERYARDWLYGDQYVDWLLGIMRGTR